MTTDAKATENTVAAEFRSDSLGAPFNGWLVFYEDTKAPPTEGLLGKLCVIGLADGKIVVKELRAGQINGRYNLHAVNGPPVYDADVEWATMVRSISQDK